MRTGSSARSEQELITTLELFIDECEHLINLKQDLAIVRKQEK